MATPVRRLLQKSERIQTRPAQGYPLIPRPHKEPHWVNAGVCGGMVMLVCVACCAALTIGGCAGVFVPKLRCYLRLAFSFSHEEPRCCRAKIVQPMHAHVYVVPRVPRLELATSSRHEISSQLCTEMYYEVCGCGGLHSAGWWQGDARVKPRFRKVVRTCDQTESKLPRPRAGSSRPREAIAYRGCTCMCVRCRPGVLAVCVDAVS